MAKTQAPPEVQSICKAAEEIDTQFLKEEPIETQGAIVNVLCQIVEHRLAMINRERAKEAKAAQLANQFGPHTKAN